MSDTKWTWPHWAPRLLWPPCKCPRCNSIQFKAAELRPYDSLLAMFALHPVRCNFCWRRYYWLAFHGAGTS